MSPSKQGALPAERLQGWLRSCFCPESATGSAQPWATRAAHQAVDEHPGALCETRLLSRHILFQHHDMTGRVLAGARGGQAGFRV